MDKKTVPVAVVVEPVESSDGADGAITGPPTLDTDVIMTEGASASSFLGEIKSPLKSAPQGFPPYMDPSPGGALSSSTPTSSDSSLQNSPLDKRGEDLTIYEVMRRVRMSTWDFYGI